MPCVQVVGLTPEELLSELQALQLAAMYDCEDAAAAADGGRSDAAAAGGLRGGLGLKGKKLLGQQAEEFLVQQVRGGGRRCDIVCRGTGSQRQARRGVAGAACD
jgi:hypothetical protein